MQDSAFLSLRPLNAEVQTSTQDTFWERLIRSHDETFIKFEVQTRLRAQEMTQITGDLMKKGLQHIIFMGCLTF